MFNLLLAGFLAATLGVYQCEVCVKQGLDSTITCEQKVNCGTKMCNGSECKTICVMPCTCSRGHKNDRAYFND